MSRRHILAACLLLATSSATGCAAETEIPPRPDGAVLYLFAHQDDEIFILARMRQDVLAGREVHACWITDGGKDGKPDARERESRAVMALLGVPAAQLHFLGFPDHDSVRFLPAVYEQVLAVGNSQAFTEVVSPAYEGGNIDHDVAALIGAKVARDAASHPAHLEFPLYNHYEGRRRIGVFLPNAASEEHTVALAGESRQVVLRALKLYRSQRWLLAYLQLEGHRKRMLDRGEAFRLAGDYDFLSRPVDEPCGYERSGLHRATFAEWQREVSAFLGASAAATAATAATPARDEPARKSAPVVAESAPTARDTRSASEPVRMAPATELRSARGR